MRRFKNESSVWTFLAKCWNDARCTGSIRDFEATIGTLSGRQYSVYGLCGSIYGLWILGSVNDALYQALKTRLQSALVGIPRYVSGGYAFTHDMEGAQERARLCRELARASQASHTKRKGRMYAAKSA